MKLHEIGTSVFWFRVVSWIVFPGHGNLELDTVRLMTKDFLLAGQGREGGGATCVRSRYNPAISVNKRSLE